MPIICHARIEICIPPKHRDPLHRPHLIRGLFPNNIKLAAIVSQKTLNIQKLFVGYIPTKRWTQKQNYLQDPRIAIQSLAH